MDVYYNFVFLKYDNKDAIKKPDSNDNYEEVCQGMMELGLKLKHVIISTSMPLSDNMAKQEGFDLVFRNRVVYFDLCCPVLKWNRCKHCH